MKRSLDHEHVELHCRHGHPPMLMAVAGYYALKEAGAPRTILGYECKLCFRRLFVTAEVPHPSPEMLDAIDTTA